MIVIIDYGMGNLHSVWKALDRLGFQSKVSSKKEDITEADRLILPGVGYFKRGMQHLSELKLIDVLNQKVVVEKTPILGICLGMQLFTKHSEEGDAEGLGWINAQTIRFNLEGDHRHLRVPHMGWNSVMPAGNNEPLFSGIETDATFYFVHSYHVVCQSSQDVLATTNYGINFVSAVRKENIFGVQFHPEKSHDNGMRLLKNFILSCKEAAVLH